MSASDLVIAYKLIKELSTPWEEWDAYKLGLIDEKGRRLKKAETPEEKLAMPKWMVLIRNIKRFIEMLPFGSTKLGSYAASLWLLKEEFGLSDVKVLADEFKRYMDTRDVLVENSVSSLEIISPGKYVFMDLVSQEEKMFRTLEPLEPVGSVFGVNVFEIEDIVTKNKYHITYHEIKDNGSSTIITD